VLDFLDSETIQNASIILGNANYGIYSRFGINTASSATLTLANTSSVTVEPSGATLSGALVNDGTIVSDAGGTLTLNATSFTNAGSISIGAVSNFYLYAGVLAIDGTLTLAQLGSITEGATGLVAVYGTLNLEGGTLDLGSGTPLSALRLGGTIEDGTLLLNGGTITFGQTADMVNVNAIGGPAYEFGYITLAQAETIASVGGGPVEFIGTLDLQGGTLDIPATGPLSDIDIAGVIKNGTVVEAGGTFFVATGATLDDLHLLGPLSITVPRPHAVYDYVYIKDGLSVTNSTGTSPGTIYLTAPGSILSFLDSETIDNVRIDFGLTSSGGFPCIEAPYYQAVTFGSHAVVDITGLAEFLAGGFINDGVINAGANSYIYDVASSFTNVGTINTVLGSDWVNQTRTLTNAGVINIGSASAFGISNNISPVLFDNTGTIAIAASGMLEVGGTITLAQLGTVDGSGTLEILAGSTLDLGGGTLVVGGTNTIDGPGGVPFGHIIDDGLITNGTIIEAGSGTISYISPGTTENVTFAVAACYLRGTRIATPSGERPIESLAIGDLVTTASGRIVPIRWIGRRAYPRRFAFGKPEIQPVLFRAGALDENMPRRDLFVSPQHAMFIDGLLIPAIHLLNGITILQPDEIRDAHYLHIELDRHDVLLAEGAPSESFEDDDSRMIFHNAHEYPALYPHAPRRPAAFCAPRVSDRAAVAAIRRHLAARAAAIGFVPPCVPEIDLASAGELRVTVPDGAEIIRLVSHSASVAGDRRRLGALLRGLRIDGASIPLHDPRLRAGFHAIEMHGTQAVRWTDGAATVHLGRGGAARLVELDVASVMA
jgi:hypothetical protein